MNGKYRESQAETLVGKKKTDLNSQPAVEGMCGRRHWEVWVPISPQRLAF